MSPYEQKPYMQDTSVSGDKKVLYTILMSVIFTPLSFYLGYLVTKLTRGEPLAGSGIPLYSNSVLGLTLGLITFILLYFIATRFTSRKLKGDEVGLYFSLIVFVPLLFSFVYFAAF